MTPDEIKSLRRTLNLTQRQLADLGEGLIACVIPGQYPVDAMLRYREAFEDRAYLLAELHLGPNDEWQLAFLQQLSVQTGLPRVAANDVHYHIPARQPLHDVRAWRMMSRA